MYVPTDMYVKVEIMPLMSTWYLEDNYLGSQQKRKES